MTANRQRCPLLVWGVASCFFQRIDKLYLPLPGLVHSGILPHLTKRYCPLLYAGPCAVLITGSLQTKGIGKDAAYLPGKAKKSNEASLRFLCGIHTHSLPGPCMAFTLTGATRQVRRSISLRAAECSLHSLRAQRVSVLNPQESPLSIWEPWLTPFHVTGGQRNKPTKPYLLVQFSKWDPIKMVIALNH